MSTATINSLSGAAGSSRLPRWVNTGLVILIGYALAVLSLKAVSQSDIQVASLTGSSATVTAAKPALDLMGIGNATAGTHLFGNAAVKVVDKPRKQVTTPVRPTRLNLKLSGVFAYEPQERAIAIITTSQGENAFRVGDKIENNATLKAVFTDRVIIDNNGKDEELRLPENVTPIASRRPVQQARSQSSGNAESSNGPVELPSTPGALRDTLAKNPSMLGRVVAAEPYQQNGKLVGYRITPKQNPEILEAQGIVAGDIITRVNNIELNSQKQGIRALRNAVKAQNLDVTILRDGVEIPISISLAE